MSPLDMATLAICLAAEQYGQSTLGFRKVVASLRVFTYERVVQSGMMHSMSPEQKNAVNQLTLRKRADTGLLSPVKFVSSRATKVADLSSYHGVATTDMPDQLHTNENYTSWECILMY